MISEVLWLVVAAGVVTVFGKLFMAIATFLGETKQSRLRKTLDVASYLLVLASGIACLWLAVILDELAVRIVVTIVGSALLTIDVLTAIAIIKDRNKSRWLAEPISQDGVVELIQSRTVNRFVLKDGTVTLSYRHKRDQRGRWLERPGTADPDRYRRYVAAAREVLDRGGRITYQNDDDPNDPSATGHRWISVEEATALLHTGQITSFGSGSPPTTARETTSGEPPASDCSTTAESGTSALNPPWNQQWSPLPERLSGAPADRC